jgi:hypothetical protein
MAEYTISRKSAIEMFRTAKILKQQNPHIRRLHSIIHRRILRHNQPKQQMKSVAELREDYLRIKQTKEADKASQTVKQLEELMPQIEKAHKAAAEVLLPLMQVNTKLDLTAQAQSELASLGYQVEPLDYPRDEKNPFLYKITWRYS